MTGPVLRDIHVPAAPWWPPAPGWWILAALVLLALVASVWLARRQRAQAPLRTALREIDGLQSAWRRDANVDASVDAASRLLRRVARRVDPPVAAEAGDAWRQFIRGHAPDPEARAALDRLLDARFRPNADIDVPVLCRALRGWCRVALRSRATAAVVPAATAGTHRVPGQ